MINEPRIDSSEEQSHDRCPNCGAETKSVAREETFLYGSGKDEAPIKVKVIVHECASCGLKVTDSDADTIRHEAVCQHLGVMTPRQIVDLRKRHGLSRSEFSRLTGIGEASLNRWENGLKIQNLAMDRLLVLLGHEENWNLLKRETKQLGTEAAGNEARVLPFRYKVLNPQPSDYEAQRDFHLRPALG